jgi:hypothetical protein
MKTNFLRLSLVVAALAAASTSAQAQVKIDDLTTISTTLKLQLQAPGYSSDSGKIFTYDKPIKQTINTKNLLSRLAIDKYAQGLYGSTSFPSGAKLGYTKGQFVVVKDNSEFIVDVSDIITISGGDYTVISGTIKTTTGLANPKTTELALLRLHFDDTFIPGGTNLKFTVQGLNTSKTEDTSPNSAGKYNEQSSEKTADLTGEGTSLGTPFVVTGNLSGQRDTALYLEEPSAE